MQPNVNSCQYKKNVINKIKLEQTKNMIIM